MTAECMTSFITIFAFYERALFVVLMRWLKKYLIQETALINWHLENEHWKSATNWCRFFGYHKQQEECLQHELMDVFLHMHVQFFREEFNNLQNGLGIFKPPLCICCLSPHKNLPGWVNDKGQWMNP